MRSAKENANSVQSDAKQAVSQVLGNVSLAKLKDIMTMLA